MPNRLQVKSKLYAELRIYECITSDCVHYDTTARSSDHVASRIPTTRNISDFIAQLNIIDSISKSIKYY